MIRRLLGILALCTFAVGMTQEAQAQTNLEPYLRYNAEKKSGLGAALREGVAPLWGYHYAGDIEKGYIPAAASGLGLLIAYSGAKDCGGYRTDGCGKLVGGALLYNVSRIWAMIGSSKQSGVYNRDLMQRLNISPALSDRGDLGIGITLKL